MKKSIISSVLVASTLLSSIPTLNSGHVAHADSMSPLTTKGKEIQKDGHNYRLKGVNAGNVFTTEQWLGGLGSAKHKDYKSINDEMDGKYGAKKTHQLLDKYTENRWEDKDFKNLKDMGMNTIRLPINYINLTNYKAGMAPKDLKMRKEPFKAMDKFIDKANSHGLYVIIDMHGVPGSQNGQEHSAEANGSIGNFWKDPDAQGKAKEIWYQIAQHYKNNNGVAGYDLLNEPKAPAQHVDEEVKEFYKGALKSIRDTGDKHIAFLEAWYPQDLKDPQEFNDPTNNIVYEYHKYPYNKETTSHKGIQDTFDRELETLNNKASHYNVPTYLGEFNAHYAGSPGPEGKNPVNPNKDDFDHIFKSFKNKENSKISWTLWNYDIENNQSWGPINFKGINVDENSNDFGKKEGAYINHDVYDTIKNNQ